MVETHELCVCDATFGQVQTKVLNVSAEGGGDRNTQSKRHQAGPAEAASERDKERPVSGNRLAALGPDTVSLLVVVS